MDDYQLYDQKKNGSSSVIDSLYFIEDEVLKQRINNALNANQVKFDIERLLMMSPRELEDFKLDPDETSRMISLVSYHLLSQRSVLPPRTFLDLIDLNEDSVEISFGCPILDDFFDGGLPTRGIIEVTGKASSGKTQFILNAVKQTVLPIEHGGLGGDALYISVEGVPNKRWDQISRHCAEDYENVSFEYMQQKLYYEMIDDPWRLKDFIHTRINPYFNRCNIKLIVIDSVTALFRGADEDIPIMQRSNYLFEMSKRLRELSDEYDLPILVVNQVTSDMNDGGYGENGVKPALGLSWSNCINMRIILSKTNKTLLPEEISRNKQLEPPTKRMKYNEDANVKVKIRKIKVIFSPYLKKKSTYFYVHNCGISGIEEL